MRSSGKKPFTIWNGAITLVSKTVRKISGVSSSPPPKYTPALFTRMSSLPYLSATAFTAASMEAWLVPSSCTNSTGRPCFTSSAAASCPLVASRAAITTVIPRLPRPMAVWYPRPLVPPVTNATEPFPNRSEGWGRGKLVSVGMVPFSM